MWIPKSEDEIIQAVQSGSLEETSIFEAKSELDKRNSEIAKDIAAMANDGGVILYGLGEDDHNRLTVLNPISLAGQKERIDSIVRTSIQEAPVIYIEPFPTANDFSLGYIVVVVPPSERAPHMVVVKGENRFYGRTATGNFPLNEGDVSRLYERRRRWEVDQNELLEEEIKRSPYPPNENYAYLYLFARPVSTSDELLSQVTENQNKISNFFNRFLEDAAKDNVFPSSYSPDFIFPSKWNMTSEGYICRIHQPSSSSHAFAPGNTLTLSIDFNGTAHLFCGKAGDSKNDDKWLYLQLIAGNTTRFLHFIGNLYEKVQYLGMIDIGVALIGLKDGIPMIHHTYRDYRPYDRDEYRKTSRISALNLKNEPMAIAEKLLRAFNNATSQGSLDPFPTHKNTE